MRLADEVAEIAHRAVGRVDGHVVGDVVPVVLQRRGIEGQHSDGRDAEVGKVRRHLGEPGEVAHTVAVGIEIAAFTCA